MKSKVYIKLKKQGVISSKVKLGDLKNLLSGVYGKQHGGNHYSNFKIQPSQFINTNNLPFAEGNAIKYICRHKYKGKKEDLKKAIHYIEMIMERDYEDTEV